MAEQVHLYCSLCVQWALGAGEGAQLDAPVYCHFGPAGMSLFSRDGCEPRILESRQKGKRGMGAGNIAKCFLIPVFWCSSNLSSTRDFSSSLTRHSTGSASEIANW